eukprot:506725_1
MSLKHKAECKHEYTHVGVDKMSSRRIPDGDKQASKIHILACCSIPIRSFYITIITFLFCQFSWFITANLFVAISEDIKLTLPEHRLASSLSITSTFIFHWIIAYLCPLFESRKTYIIVLFCSMITLIALAVIQSSVGYIICHIFLGIAGTSYTVSEYHITRLFEGKILGSAQAITAGFGNFGGGVVNFIAPMIVYYFEISWRWFLFGVSVILFLLCFIYYFGSKDSATIDPDLSYNLINLNNSRVLREIRGEFGAKIKDRPATSKIKAAASFSDAFYDYRVWVLFACHAASSGVEITFYMVGAHYYINVFGLSEIWSGLIVMMWSAINLIARPYGGYLCDKYPIPKRGKIIFILLFLEAILIILFGAMGRLSLSASIITSMLFSICVQMAEGAIFSIVVFVQPKSVGHVIGIVASGANAGAAFFIFVIFLPWTHTDYGDQYSWVLLGAVVMICSFCALMIQFTKRELHDSSADMAAYNDLDAAVTKTVIK